MIGDPFAPDESQAKDFAEERMRIAGLFHRVFTTEDGKALLKLMRERTIEKPVCHADSTMIGVGIRQGQNNVVKQIEDNIRLVEEGNG